MQTRWSSSLLSTPSSTAAANSAAADVIGKRSVPEWVLGGLLPAEDTTDTGGTSTATSDIHDATDVGGDQRATQSAAHGHEDLMGATQRLLQQMQDRMHVGRRVEVAPGVRHIIDQGDMGATQVSVRARPAEPKRRAKTAEKQASADALHKAAEQGDVSAQLHLGNMYLRGAADGQSKAMHWFRLAAQQGSRDAYFAIGFMLEMGMAVERSEASAISYYTEAASEGHVGAQYALGMMYASGRGTATDDVEALRWFRMAAEQGDADAQRELGEMIAQGRDGSLGNSGATSSFDVTEAGINKELQARAERGDIKAQVEIGNIYLRRNGDALEYAKAMYWFRKAALLKNCRAQFVMGFMHEMGLSGQQNDEEALYWYKLAAEQGHPVAQYGLGMIRAHGPPSVRDDKEALKWLRRAAEQDDTDSQRELGNIYAHGRAARPDVNEARLWFERASAGGDADAANSLGSMAANGVGRPQDLEEAVRFFQIAAERESPLAWKNLGDMHARGHGLPKDNAKAVQWYRLAVDQGHAPAMKSLAKMYSQGLGVPQDFEEAARLRTLALNLEKGQPQGKKRRDYLKIHLEDKVQREASAIVIEPGADALPEACSSRRGSFIENVSNMAMSVWQSRKSNDQVKWKSRKRRS